MSQFTFISYQILRRYVGFKRRRQCGGGGRHHMERANNNILLVPMGLLLEGLSFFKKRKKDCKQSMYRQKLMTFFFKSFNWNGLFFISKKSICSKFRPCYLNQKSINAVGVAIEVLTQKYTAILVLRYLINHALLLKLRHKSIFFISIISTLKHLDLSAYLYYCYYVCCYHHLLFLKTKYIRKWTKVYYGW